MLTMMDKWFREMKQINIYAGEDAGTYRASNEPGTWNLRTELVKMEPVNLGTGIFQ